MKTILWVFLLGVTSGAHAQSKPPSCDELQGPDREVCLKQGGTVKANTAGNSGDRSAASGSTAKPDPDWPKLPKRLDGERYAEPGAPTDYSKRDSK